MLIAVTNNIKNVVLASLKWPEFVAYIKECLIEKQWSLKMLSGRLNAALGFSSCVETIYRYIFADPGAAWKKGV